MQIAGTTIEHDLGGMPSGSQWQMRHANPQHGTDAQHASCCLRYQLLTGAAACAVRNSVLNVSTLL